MMNKTSMGVVMKNIHFSVDDFFDSLMDLEVSSYNDLFDQPIFHSFRELHDEYGCTFSGYCFASKDGKELKLLNLSNKLSKQLKDNADWLKLGFHSWENESDYGSKRLAHERVITDYDTAYRHCKTVIETLKRICDGEGNLDIFPRIHYFAGSKECCRAWKDLGMKGLLAADDDRESYYFDKMTRDKLLKEHIFYDQDMDMYFIETNMRLERVDDVKEEWNKLIGDKNKTIDAGNIEYMEVFTHEKYLTDPATWEKFNVCAKLAINAGYSFGFVQNCIDSCHYVPRISQPSQLESTSSMGLVDYSITFPRNTQ